MMGAGGLKILGRASGVRVRFPPPAFRFNHLRARLKVATGADFANSPFSVPHGRELPDRLRKSASFTML
jgi:hypothetical protein